MPGLTNYTVEINFTCFLKNVVMEKLKNTEVAQGI